MTNRMQAGILAVVAICAGLVAETSIDPARSAHAANRNQPRRELQAGAKKGRHRGNSARCWTIRRKDCSAG